MNATNASGDSANVQAVQVCNFSLDDEEPIISMQLINVYLELGQEHLYGKDTCKEAQGFPARHTALLPETEGSGSQGCKAEAQAR